MTKFKLFFSTVSIVALDQIAQPLGYGSGFIIDDELIVTNVHVIEGCNSAYILKNGEEKKYTVSGYVAIDKTNDLVILKVSGLSGTKVTLGNDSLPNIGEKIYAVGNPKGLNGTFSEGIISGIRKMIADEVLQITAPISPGSSGGPVLNSNAQVVGIAFASFTEGQNLNFAIPVKYLLILKTKMGSLTALSTVKVELKPKTSVNTDIKEGVSIRDISVEYGHYIAFSIKNNLSNKISNVVILFLIYDETGTVVDYVQTSRYDCNNVLNCGIEPYLAKSFVYGSGGVEFHASSCSFIKARVLDFKINE